MRGKTMAGNILARGKPHTGQRLHPRDEAIQHGNAQGAPRYEGMQADVEVSPLPILLKEACPPHVEYAVGVGEALLAVGARVPGEAEEHRVIDREVERQFEEAWNASAIQHVVGSMVCRTVGIVNIA